jgi:hypothetical protein
MDERDERNEERERNGYESGEKRPVGVDVFHGAVRKRDFLRTTRIVFLCLLVTEVIDLCVCTCAPMPVCVSVCRIGEGGWTGGGIEDKYR